MKEIFFVRHGETEWNAERRMQGQLDSPLSARGIAQAETNRDLLATQSIGVLFCSPLGRCRQTAEIINARLQLPLNVDDRIKEWDVGEWSGHLYSEARERWPREFAALDADPFHYRGPGCENVPDMIARARPFLRELVALDAERIAVISHGMIGTVMVSQLLGFGEAETLEMHQDNATVIVVTLGRGSPSASHFASGDGPRPGIG